MKNALILHGTHNTSQGNWFPWLRTELEKQGYTVWCPDLPRADHPDLDQYSQFIFNNAQWSFTSETSVVGHSSGGVFALKLLQLLPDDITINRCVTVGASFTRHGDDPIQGLFTIPWDFSNIKRHAKQFVIFHSDDDPYVPLSDAYEFKKKLDAELVLIKGQGHFNLEKSPAYRQFPKLLEKIVK